MLDIPMQMAEGNDVHVTWPCNPVGSGFRGHKPASHKRRRQSTTPPTPCSQNNAFAYAPSSQPAAAPTSAATSAFPEVQQPTGIGAPVLQSASPAAQPAVHAVHAAHAQIRQTSDQPAQLPSGFPHQLPVSATLAHTSSLPQPQLLPQDAQQQQQQAQQQQALASQQPLPQPSLQSLSQAPLPQSQITQTVMSQPGQSKAAAGVSSDRLPSQSRLIDHQISAAVLSPTTALEQPSAVSHAHAPAQTGASLQPPGSPEHTANPEAQPESHLVAQAVAQPATHSEPGQSRVSGEPSVVAAIKEQTLPALVQSSNSSENSKNANVLNAQRVAADDGIQAMDLNEDTTGTNGQLLCVCGNLEPHSL